MKYFYLKNSKIQRIHQESKETQQKKLNPDI